MTGIGVSLEDLGIKRESDSAEPTQRHDYNEFPKEYDFTLDLFLHGGSWRQLRDSLRAAVSAAYNGEPPLHFSMYWAEMENETEESITASSLAGVRYDKVVHEVFGIHHREWAENEENPDRMRQAMTVSGPHQESVRAGLAVNALAPQDVLEELVKDSLFNYELLENPSLTEQMIRDIYAMVKSGSAGPRAMAYARTELPADVVEALAKRDYLESWTPIGIAQQRNVTEHALLDLIGKCHESWIRSSPACTDNVRNKIRWCQGLTLGERECAAGSLKKIRSAIDSGLTGAIRRRGGVEEALLDAVMANPNLSLSTVNHLIANADNAA